MSMSLTWIAIIASLLMGVGALLIFILAVKKDYFRNLEETKYQVFWSDVEDLVESAQPASRLASSPHAFTEDDHHGSGQTRQTSTRTTERGPSD